jgi:hypothetical protein
MMFSTSPGRSPPASGAYLSAAIAKFGLPQLPVFQAENVFALPGASRFKERFLTSRATDESR